MPSLPPFKPGLSVKLAPQGGIADQVHVFEERDYRALVAALAAGRPLLVRGEPGTGKSQLARAAAKLMKRTCIQHVVDSQTESRDLLWRLDTVRRLAEAQLAGAIGDQSADKARAELALQNFVVPGPLWWAFDWESAKIQAARSKTPVPERDAEGDTANGYVVLIDEIDKAESEVPNGLLEALGAGRLAPPELPAVFAKPPAPLVIITTNEERSLPDAFIRRCLVLKLQLPTDKDQLIKTLTDRGKAHFPKKLTRKVLTLAAEMLHEDRTNFGDARPRPGQAEYLDMLRAVVTLHGEDEAAQLVALEQTREFVLQKHVE
ncbi:hypothetical protein CCR94_07545 [Rhodoblastus sphagnicola]|uniref:AAA+ ATPase domain-containing protein n=2 Tax=Rhodoblastus sphagnicola TaxID=333368 RepID=A0A2S6NBT5_9HYPH|nr:hypothetical protein CCR94_07545 [Rhodoblastus sphagnicola]